MTASRLTHHRRRGRRPRTYAAVLTATTELLHSVSLAELSVAQILEAASVGRTSFYEHFSSKDDVVVKLMRSISAEVGEAIQPMFHHGDRTPEDAFGEGLGNMLRMWLRYRGPVIAITEEWPAVPELRAIWFAMLGDVVTQLAATIERERVAGTAPPGADPVALAAALTWSAERSFHVAMTGAHPTLADPDALLEPLRQLYVGSIYGRPVRAPERA